MHPVIDTCIKSMERVCGADFTLVTNHTLDQYVRPGTLCREFELLKQPAHRADCIRAALLAVHGGMWLDADTVMLHKPQIGHRDDKFYYSKWKNDPHRVITGYVFANGKTEVAKAWLDAVNETLIKWGTTDVLLEWTSLGEKILTPIVWNQTADKVSFIDRRHWLPIDVDSDVARFFSTRDWRDECLGRDTFCFGMNWSWMMANMPDAMNLDPSLWKDSPLLIHQLLEDARSKNGTETV